MNEALPPDMVVRIKELIGQNAAPGDIRAETHEICDRVEAALRADMDGEALITIHVEPKAKTKLSGVPVL